MTRTPAHVLVVCVLGILAWAALGGGPGSITALWLALVSPSLVVIDVRLRRLPNVLVVPGLGAALIDAGWFAVESGRFPAAAVLATSILVAAMLALNLLGGLGMGDVKLTAVIAGCLSLFSPWTAVAAVLLAFMLGGVYSAALLIRRREGRAARIAFGPVLLLAFWAVITALAAQAASVVSVS
ncbi:prepilin peptidase [Agreia sp. PsM10]|uniref:prepilin peptidase n=1 Tax=Agreia sp. PsM10 TaxID=3030533 RepID=UPI00263BBA98|nr:prepilin peptidase [Agreia sp. PsM10]MDN4638679.1 prepilin peptidase [Agreia sp. PsM10]